MPDRRLTSLLDYVTAGDRISPMPDAWVRLHRLLGGDAPTPLILGGWCLPWWMKRRQLRAQIRYAAEHGRLERLDRFLRRLPEEEWYSEGEAERRRDREPLVFRMLAEPRRSPSRSVKGGRQLSLPLP